MSAFVAQNMGAGKPERARHALFCGIASSLAIGTLMGYFAFFHGNLLAGLFAKDLPVIAAAALYLKAYAVDCLFTAFLFCFIGYFNGTGATMLVMLQGIVGAFGVRLPLSWFISRQSWANLFYIGLSTPASTLVQIVLCGLYLAYTLRKQEKHVLNKT
jgi:Na+-driven multidrug efflux pump